jgi:hypothetical protein
VGCIITDSGMIAKILSYPPALSYAILTATLKEKHLSPDYTDGKTEAKGCEEICCRSHS